MADELTLVQNARLNISGQNKLLIAHNQEIDVSSSLMIDDVVSIGTSEEDLSFGDISTVGLFWIMNLDETNYVEFGPKSGGSMVAIGKLPAKVAGEPPFIAGPIRLKSGTVIRCVANTAACLVRFICLNN